MTQRNNPLSHIKNNLPAIAFSLWIVGLISAYYALHNPLSDGNWAALFDAVIDIILAISLVGLAGGLGKRIIGDIQVATPLERMALYAALGLGCLGLGTLLIGWLGLISTVLAWLVLIMGILLLRKDVSAWFFEWKDIYKAYQQAGRLGRFSAWYISLILFISLIQALAPPLKWDSLVYHLELPKQYVSAGKIEYVDGNSFTGHPQNTEMLYTWAMALRDETTAVVLGWAVGFSALAGVAGFARRLFGANGTWLAPAFLLAGRTLAQTLHWGFVGYWLFIFGLGMTLALDYYLQTESRKWLAIVGALLGFALGTKYTAGVLVPIAISVLVVERLFHKIKEPEFLTRLRSLIAEIAIIGCLALLVMSPWLFKNLIQTGNPIYPLVFKGRGMDDLLWQFYQDGQAEEYIPTFQDNIFLPIQITVFSLDRGILEEYPGYFADIGPLLVGLIPGLFFGWISFNDKQRRTLYRLILIAITAWIVWAFAGRFYDQANRTRHYFGVFPAIALLSTAGYYALAGKKVLHIKLQRIAAFSIVLVLLLAGIREIAHFANVNPLPPVLGYQSKNEYIKQELFEYADAMATINQFPPQSKVTFLWEPRGFYCEIQCDPDEVFDKWWYWRRKIGDASSIAATLREKEITHVLLYNYGPLWWQENGPLFISEDWMELESFINNEVELISEFGEIHSLFELKY